MTVEVKVKKSNSWIVFLKEYSKEHGVSYSSLIGDPKIKELYMASKKPVTSIEVVPEVSVVENLVITEKVKQIKKLYTKEMAKHKEKKKYVYSKKICCFQIIYILNSSILLCKNGVLFIMSFLQFKDISKYS